MEQFSWNSGNKHGAAEDSSLMMLYGIMILISFCIILLDHLWVLFPDVVMVLGSEVAVDVVKHAFITKFNDISADVSPVCGWHFYSVVYGVVSVLLQLILSSHYKAKLLQIHPAAGGEICYSLLSPGVLNYTKVHWGMDGCISSTTFTSDLLLCLSPQSNTTAICCIIIYHKRCFITKKWFN